MKVCRYLHAYPSALFVVVVMYGFAHCSTYMCKFVGSKGIFPKNTENQGTDKSAISYTYVLSMYMNAFHFYHVIEVE